MCNKTQPLDQSLFQDSAVRTVGTTPQALAAPNQYFAAGDINVNTYTEFARLVGTTSDTSLRIEAATWAAVGPAFTSQVVLWVDGVALDHSFFGALDAVPTSWTVALDGNPHTIEIEEAAPIVAVYGAVTWTPKFAPKYRAIIAGDSISCGQGASVPSKCYALILRHSLASGVAGYGVTDQSRSGALLGSTQPTGAKLAVNCDGTTRNVIVLAMVINDYLNNVTLGQFQVETDAFVTSILANCPAGTRIVLVTSPQCPIAASGATLAQLRAVFVAKAAANPGVVYCVDNTNLYPGGTPWAASTDDGIHPNDAGHALWAAAIRPVLISAATDP